jgi:hypothetical protein
MSSGPGRVQRHALEILSREPGKMWNAFDIAAEVYEIGEDRDGEWIIPDAPAVAVRRALLDLRKQGKAECSNRYYNGCRYWWLAGHEPDQSWWWGPRKASQE